MINKFEKYRLIENFNLDSLNLETENILEDQEVNIENLLGSIIPEESINIKEIVSEETLIRDKKKEIINENIVTSRQTIEGKISENIVTNQQSIDNIIDENIVTTQETDEDPNSEVTTSNIVSEEEKKGGGINNKFILIIILFTIFYFLLNPKN